MRQPSFHPALRYGLPAAIAIMALGSANTAVQAWRHTAGPSARWLVVFSYLFFLVTALLLLRAGYRSARATGHLSTSARAGALAAALPAALLAIVANLQALARLSPRDGAAIAGYVIAVLLISGAGALIGAMVSLPAALVARSRYHAEHATGLAALAAERAAQREHEREARALRKRQKKKDDVPWQAVLPAVVALLLIVVAPGFAAQWAGNTFLKWQGFALAVASLAVGAALLAASKRVGWLGYVFDWLGVAFLFSGALLGIGELTGYFIGLLASLAGLVYLWRLGDRMVFGDSPPTERPERPPVLFRYDGEAIVIYPSRRKLALHAAFAGGVAVIAAALAVLLHGFGPTPVVALGAFAVGGLIGFIPDIARLLIRRPALIVNHDGITDQASAGLMGFGLIPWHEIAGAFNAGGLRGSAWPELAIVPVSFRRLLLREPLLKRPFLRLGSAMGGGMIFIGSLFLSQPPSEVARRIHDYVKSHAPVGYAEPDEDLHEDQDEREDGGDGDAERAEG